MPDSQVLSPAAQWAVVSGFLMPLVIACIQQPHWKTEFKTAIGFLACVVCAVIQLSIEGKLDTRNFFPTVVLVLTVSVGTFHHFWEKLGITSAIEKGTSPDSEAGEEK